MLYLWYFGSMFYGIYAVAADLYFGLIVQPQLFAAFTLINIIQVYWYGYRWSLVKTTVASMLLCAFYTGLHIGLWKAEVKAIDTGHEKLVTFLGVLPAILIALGFFPEFYVCIKEKSVEMSNFFIMLDILGGVFSTISLAFDHTFDYVASITYLIVVLLDIVLALMKLYFYFRGTQGIMRRIPASTLPVEVSQMDLPDEHKDSSGAIHKTITSQSRGSRSSNDTESRYTV
ncbi:hypothetical protein H4S08_001677 [Coemansia sp. RSA 1365]|nr:hypothetical protein H4S08_001677 [Coemansia sp. RSA 1365]